MFVTIGFCKGKGNSVITSGIRYLDRSHSSHVYCQLGSIAFHAHEENQNVMTLKEIKEIYIPTEAFHINVSNSQYARIKAFCETRVEWKYSKRSVIGVGLNRVFGTPNFLWEDGKQNCAEHIGRILNILGAKIPEQEFKIIGIKRVHDEFMKMSHAALAYRKVYNVS